VGVMKRLYEAKLFGPRPREDGRTASAAQLERKRRRNEGAKRRRERETRERQMALFTEG
jgi:hypothetical protein